MTKYKNAKGCAVRVRSPERRQVKIRLLSLDEMLPQNHPARSLWVYLNGSDLSEFYRNCQSVVGGRGRDSVDPQILICLWMLATLEGVGKARHLARLCQRDTGYLWICGGVGVNRDLLNTFRTAHAEALNELMIETIATLCDQNLISLERVAQDGMRVRASAGKSSFRRKPTLEGYLEEARNLVESLQDESGTEDESEIEDELEEDGLAGDEETAEGSRSEAARERAANERLERVKMALEEREKLHAQKESRKKGSGMESRVSTTDPEARNMKMANGGYSPAYNVQFATTTKTLMIVGVDVTNQGTDAGLVEPMLSQIEENYGERPKEVLVDGGFNSREDFTRVEKNGTRVFSPLKQEDELLAKGKDPYARQRDDTDEYYAFRQRMGTEEAKAIYQERSATAEFPNAGCRNRGLQQFPVRGLEKVRALAIWQALIHNFQMMRTHGWLDQLFATN